MNDAHTPPGSISIRFLSGPLAEQSFPIRKPIVTLGVHSETTGKDSLIGSDPSYHGTLFSIYSQSDATQRILLAWACLGGIILLLLITIGLALKAKDVRK
jgi:hypothetical protein